MEQYLSNVITDDDLQKIRPGEFNILRAPCGWGKTTFMFDDRILNFARAKKHVLYLIHNKTTRDFIAFTYKDKAKVFSDCNCNGWFDHRRKGLWTSEEDEDYVHVMCYQTFAALLRNEGTDWLGDIDLIVWDEFDDLKKYYEKEIKDVRKILPNFSRERLVALLQEGRATSLVNFVYRIKTHILEPGRIRLLAVSATPENAAYYFRDYVNYILDGKLEEKFHALETIYIESVVQAIHDDVFPLGRKYWCFTNFITDAFRIAENARSKGFNPLVLWSEDNPNWRHLMNTERKEALRMVREEHCAPPQYDFIITTSVNERGLNIYDTSIQDWICNSNIYEEVEQFLRARFNPARQYLLESSRGIIDFTQNGFPIDYYEWHNLEELRQLIIEKPIFTAGIEKKKIMSFNAVKKEYPELFEMRKYGRARETQYRIKPAE